MTKRLGRSIEETMAVIRPTINGKLTYARIPIRRKRPEDILEGKVKDGDDIQRRLASVAQWYNDFASDEDNIALYATIQAYCVPVEEEEYVRILEEEPYEISDIDMSSKGPVIDYLTEYQSVAGAYTEDTWTPESGIDELLYFHNARQLLKWLSQYFRLVPKPGVEIEHGEEIEVDEDEIRARANGGSQALF